MKPQIAGNYSHIIVNTRKGNKPCHYKTHSVNGGQIGSPGRFAQSIPTTHTFMRASCFMPHIRQVSAQAVH